MPLYKFKVYFEDNEDVYRIIEMKPGTKFLQFHDIILQSVGFDNKHDAVFYMSDDTWKKGQAIYKEKKGDEPTMADAKLNAYIIDPHQKILFLYDGQWWFNCELSGIVMNEDAATIYPHLAKSVGKPPKQYAGDKKFGENLEEDEFDYITRNLLAGDVSEEELKEHEGFGSEGEDEESEEEEDENGLFDNEGGGDMFDED